jgi:hypothetical protein
MRREISRAKQSLAGLTDAEVRAERRRAEEVRREPFFFFFFFFFFFVVVLLHFVYVQNPRHPQFSTFYGCDPTSFNTKFLLFFVANVLERCRSLRCWKRRRRHCRPPRRPHLTCNDARGACRRLCSPAPARPSLGVCFQGHLVITPTSTPVMMVCFFFFPHPRYIIDWEKFIPSNSNSPNLNIHQRFGAGRCRGTRARCRAQRGTARNAGAD